MIDADAVRIVVGSLLLVLGKRDVAGKWHYYILIDFLIYFNTANVTVALTPTEVTAPLYTLVNFTCESMENFFHWTIQSHSLIDPSNQDIETSVTTTSNISVDVWSSVLTIRALPINDGIIVIGCTVVTKNLDIIPKGATLTVLGLFLYFLGSSLFHFM